MTELKVGDRVQTPYLELGTVVEILAEGERKWPKAKVELDGLEDPQFFFVDSLRLYDPEAELERVLVRAEYSESTDALMLAGEIRRLRARLEAVRAIMADPNAFYGEDVTVKVLRAVRGE